MDLRLDIFGNDKGAGVTLDGVASKVVGLGKVLYEFSKESVKAFEEQAKADRQLAAWAGESTQALKDQATAMQEQLGVSDDSIEKMQTMLGHYGQAPAAINATIRAIEDMTAVTGGDATAAISQLTSSVTSGKQAFKDLGIVYDQTGSRADVLKAATEALAKKFGGSAAAEADSLTGNLNKAKQQFGELQETIGGFVSGMVTQLEILPGVTQMFREFNYALGGGVDELEMSAGQKKILAVTDEIRSLKAALEDLKGSGAGAGDLEHIIDQIAAAQKELKSLKNGGLSNEGEASHIKAGKNTDAKDAAKALKDAKKIDQERRRDEEDANDYALQLQRKFQQTSTDTDEEWAKQEDKEFQDALRKKAEDQKKADEKQLQNQKEMNQKSLEETKKAAEAQKQQQKEWEAAGEAIAGSFTHALSQGLEALATGGELDAGDTIGSILGTILSVAGLGSLGTQIGGLATAGIHAATGSGRVGRRHGGGWGLDGLQRYHTGGWVGGSDEELAVLKRNERVVSPAEVAGMGGPEGVERAISGRGASHVSINTFDAGSFRGIFEGRGAKGIQDAVRTGQGPAASFFR